MATHKSGGSTKNGRDSNPQFLGIKKNAMQQVKPGNIIVRQRGNKFWPGQNCGIGKDFTIFSKIKGRVSFSKGFRNRKYINVLNDKKENK